MQINRALLEKLFEAGEKRHFMTKEERKLKKRLIRLLVDKKHPKYARRFLDFDFNLVDAKKFPDFTAAVSFDDATVYLSTGFLGDDPNKEDPAIFNQLDVLLRHELAHNLMLHQIRMMYIYKQKHSNDPEAAASSLSASMSLHHLMNVIEDLEISNKRYSAADKKIVHYMTLNGKLIGGLITDELRPGWIDMSLEEMFEELSAEITQINNDIRTDPSWTPVVEGDEIDKDTGKKKQFYDPVKLYTSEALALYADASATSKIYCPLEEYIQTREFQKIESHIKTVIQSVYAAFKDVDSAKEKEDLLELVKQIAATGPQETFDLLSPFTGELICVLYSPEEKLGASEALKNLGGLINQNKFKHKVKVKIKKTSHSADYTGAWNKVVTTICNSGDHYDDQELLDLLAEIMGS